MQKNICFVVPTFPPHYFYACDFQESFKKYGYDKQADLYYIFTTPEERDGFLPCNSIVLPQSLRIMKNRGIINIKKFYALMKLKNQYEYIIVLDDDCQFCNHIDLLKLCEDYFSNKILYGNILEAPPWDIMGTVVKSCKGFFDSKYEPKLNCPLYLWFNQVPIYKTSTLNDFFKITNLGERLPKLTFFNFDYYIYMLYLILKFEFQTEDIGITSNISISEITSADKYKLVNNMYRTQNLYMASEYAKNILNLSNVFITLHKDRVSIPKNCQGKIRYSVFAIKKYLELRKILS